MTRRVIYNCFPNALNRIGLSAVVLTFAFSCSVAEPKANAKTTDLVVNSSKASEPRGATIPIDKNGPADTVRLFYAKLREKKFREALFLTNLRPAVESLTDAELKDFSLDFEAIAGEVPAEIQINGEIISGETATVTAKFPDKETGKDEVQTIKLRSENGVWVILTVEDEAEKRIKAEGKDYFYNLRIETHEDEAKAMLERISKAELAYSIQHGSCAEFQVLVTEGLLPDDVLTS